jgi:hypothetical protein
LGQGSRRDQQGRQQEQGDAPLQNAARNSPGLASEWASDGSTPSGVDQSVAARGRQRSGDGRGPSYHQAQFTARCLRQG